MNSPFFVLGLLTFGLLQIDLNENRIKRKSKRRDYAEAIANVRFVNRLAQLYGVSPLFTEDDKEWLQVADFCLDVVIQVFQNRMINKNSIPKNFEFI